MADIEIMSLRPEYQKMVMNNQKKYNPNFDNKLDGAEIGVLMTEAGAKSVEELLPTGFQVERADNVPVWESDENENVSAKVQTETVESEPADEDENCNPEIKRLKNETNAKEAKRIAKAIEIEDKNLDKFKTDLKYGMYENLNAAESKHEGLWAGATVGSAAGMLDIFGKLLSLDDCVTKGMELFRNAGLFLAAGLVIGVVIDLCRRSHLKKKYHLNLEETIKAQESKVRELKQEYKKLTGRDYPHGA